MRDGAAAAQGRYIHGDGAREADRLAAQSAYWRDELILPGLAARSGESLLEIGCATGATLAEIGRAVPGLRLAGIDHVTKPDYEQRKETIQSQIAANRQNALLEQWFSVESIRARCGFKAAGS